MSDQPAGTTPASNFAVEYSQYSHAAHNLDFKGSGQLVIDPAGPTYTFTGAPRQRGMAAPHTLVFSAADIVNVTFGGTTVQFKTALGQSGAKRQPFVFFLREPTEARAVAAALPRTVDREFTEARDFAARLDALGGDPRPWTSVTNVIVGLNLAAFVVMGSLGAGWFQTASMRPYILYAANNGAATTDGEWWRLLTSMFAHYGVMHLLLNMWALYQAGHFVEKLLGRWPYALMYLASGIMGGLASIAWHGDQSWSAGASGAVFGVYGAILGFMLREKQALPKALYESMLKSTVTFAGYNILYGLARAGIDNSAHLGGAAGGVAFGWLLALPVDAQVRARATRGRLITATAVLAALLAAGIAFTPRFNYRVSEVLAWEDLNDPLFAREKPLLAQLQQSLRGLEGTTNEAEFATWLESELIPFYTGWTQRLDQLALAPDKATAATRSQLRQLFALRLQSYRTLLSWLRTHDHAAEGRFVAESAAVAKAIDEFNAAHP